MTALRLSLFSVLALIPLAAGGLQVGEPDSIRTYVLDPVVVTATNLEVLRSTVPTAVSVVNRAQIRETGEHAVLSVVSRLVPGVFVTERGVLGFGVAQGAAGGISIRGAGGTPNTQVLVLTDGRPQMMGLFGHPLPDSYVTSGVERIEVVRGPASVLYGTNAMGGVINILTPHPSRAESHLSAGVSGGTFGTSRVEASGGYGNGVAGAAASFSRSATEGHRPWSSFKIANGSLRAGLQLTDDYSLSVDMGLSDFRTYDPGPVFAPRIDNWVDILRGSSGLALENRHSRMAGALKLFFNFGRHRIYDGFSSHDQHAGIMLYQSFQLASETSVTVGGDLMRYGGFAENTSSGRDFGEHHVSEAGGYVQTQHRFSAWLSAQAGVRVNRGSTYGTTAVPQLGVAVRPGEGTSVKVSMSRGFRSPTIRELYLFPAPTPTLKPERIWNYEIGWLQTIGTTASVEVTGFVAEGDNIIRVEGTFPNLLLTNSGRFVHRGIEAAASAEPLSGLAVDVAYSFLEPGDQTMGNPRHKLTGQMRYRLDSLTLSTAINYVEGLFGSDFKRNPIGAYAVVSLRVTCDVLPSLSVFAAGDNLLNRSYEVMRGYVMPGRALEVGVNWGMQ
jgi:iron complex outermembrane receptor protein